MPMNRSCETTAGKLVRVAVNWAIRRGVSVYLKLRERAEFFSSRRAGGTRPAFDHAGLPENAP
jgi:hypothetical protein